MIRRRILPLLWCTAALAQLPTPQAPAPRLDTATKSSSRKIPPVSKAEWRVDAIATGADGRPVPDLAAADFEIETDGKSQNITAAQFHSADPLHIALLVDDLSLSPDNIATLQKALHDFVAGQMRPNDQAVILRTSASDGIADQFTSDRTSLAAAIDRLRSNPPARDSRLAFSTGSIGALRSTLLGLQFTPGRKLLVFLSERLRSADRTPDSNWISRLISAADRSAVVFYAVDVSSTAQSSFVLEQGLAAVPPQTGGTFFDAAGNPAAAMAGIMQSQQSYYLLRFETEPLQRTIPLTVKTSRPGVRISARAAVLGLAEDEGHSFLAPENQLRAGVASALLATGLHLGLTPKPGVAGAPNLQVQLRIDLNEVSLTLEPDGEYHGQLEATAALFQENDASVSQTSRVLILHITPAERQKLIESGFDFAMLLPAPKKGPYQLRAAVLDDTNGGLGAAARFFEAQDPPLPLLTMAPIQLEPAGDPTRPVYPPGHPVRYSYELANLRNDGSNHAKVEVTNRLLRDGNVVYSGAPNVLDVPLLPHQTNARITGTVKLAADVKPGKFTLSVTTLDTLANESERRSATQTIEFDIEP